MPAVYVSSRAICDYNISRLRRDGAEVAIVDMKTASIVRSLAPLCDSIQDDAIDICEQRFFCRVSSQSSTREDRLRDKWCSVTVVYVCGEGLRVSRAHRCGETLCVCVGPYVSRVKMSLEISIRALVSAEVERR